MQYLKPGFPNILLLNNIEVSYNHFKYMFYKIANNKLPLTIHRNNNVYKIDIKHWNAICEHYKKLFNVTYDSHSATLSKKSICEIDT